MLTPMYELCTIEPIGAETGTIVTVLEHATAENMLAMSFTPPPSPYGVSSFQSLKSKLCGNFRVTLRGVVQDLENLEYAQSGSEKRMFNLVDKQGYYLNCCAMVHNVTSRALQDFNEIIVYFAIGRGPIGNSPGLIYLYKDAVIISHGPPRLLSTPKKRSSCK